MITIYGLHAVQSLLQHKPERIKRLIIAKEQKRKLQSLIDSANKQNITIEEQTSRDFDQRFPKQTHQGICALCVPPPSYREKDLPDLLAQLKQPALLLVLDGVQDPHNLGACWRTAAAMGVGAIIVPRDNAVSLTATVHKVACGAVDLVPLVQVTNLSRTLKQLREQKFWCYGAELNAECSVQQIDFSGNVVLVLGAEHKGMRRLTREHCDQLFQIPMQDDVESLNVSVAAGICLYEVMRQRIGP